LGNSAILWEAATLEEVGSLERVRGWEEWVAPLARWEQRLEYLKQQGWRMGLVMAATSAMW